MLQTNVLLQLLNQSNIIKNIYQQLDFIQSKYINQFVMKNQKK